MLNNETIDIPCPTFRLVLSDWDRRCVTLHSRRILCFGLSDDSRREHITTILAKAFTLLVHDLPFLAGSIVPYPTERGGAPWLRDIEATGSAKLVVKDLSDEIHFGHLRASNFNQDLLSDDKLCPFDRPMYTPDDTVDVCRLQANFVSKGLLLTVSIVHVVADGSGITEIIKLLADKIRVVEDGLASGAPMETDGSDGSLFDFDRDAFLTQHDGHGSIENHRGWTDQPPKPQASNAKGPVVCKTFSIPKSLLKELKSIASDPSSGQPSSKAAVRISTHDSIVALLWRSILLARHRAEVVDLTDDTGRLSIPIDFKSRLGLPEPYYGNAFYGSRVEVKFTQFLTESAEAGISVAAAAIRTELNSVDKARVRDLLNLVRDQIRQYNIRPSILDYHTTSGMFSTSYWTFDHYGLDFGDSLGHHMESFRLPVKGLTPGMSVVLPRVPTGGCEVMVSEHQETMERLMQDDFFARFATECA